MTPLRFHFIENVVFWKLKTISAAEFNIKKGFLLHKKKKNVFHDYRSNNNNACLNLRTNISVRYLQILQNSTHFALELKGFQRQKQRCVTASVENRSHKPFIHKTIIFSRVIVAA